MKWYGKTVNMPRLTAYHGDPDTLYTYSGVSARPCEWTPTLTAIKHRIEPVAGVTFNYVILQLYRDGRDSVSWHSDAEPTLGRNPVIGSVSLGTTRLFQFKHRQKPEQKAQVLLAHGSLLVMSGATQHFWRHQIPKTTRPCGARINLTFRVVKSPEKLQ
jgi:alkylated DNA repair dioxygenase AlkB